MLREQVCQEWNSCQELISQLKPFRQKKELIIDAVELHLHQASSFTSEHANEPLLNRREMAKEKDRLTHCLEQITQRHVELSADQRLRPSHKKEKLAELEHEKEETRKKITELETALLDNSITNAFNIQKTKYQQIVKECRELLAKLRE